jgi:hypothetical protein
LTENFSILSSGEIQDGVPFGFFHTSWFLIGRQFTIGMSTQFGTLIASPFLIERSKDQERWPNSCEFVLTCKEL